MGVRTGQHVSLPCWRLGVGTEVHMWTAGCLGGQFGGAWAGQLLAHTGTFTSSRAAATVSGRQNLLPHSQTRPTHPPTHPP